MEDMLERIGRGERICATEVAQACGHDPQKRQETEALLTLAGYFYAIAHDAFMPPTWVAAMRENCK